MLEFGIDHLQWERDNWSYMRRVTGLSDEEQPDAPRHAHVNASRQAIMDILIPWFDFATSNDAHTGADGVNISTESSKNYKCLNASMNGP